MDLGVCQRDVGERFDEGRWTGNHAGGLGKAQAAIKHWGKRIEPQFSKTKEIIQTYRNIDYNVPHGAQSPCRNPIHLFQMLQNRGAQQQSLGNPEHILMVENSQALGVSLPTDTQQRRVLG